MKKGDHLISPRTGYSHHGLYIGNNQVIHYSGLSIDLSTRGVIEITSLDEFSRNKGIKVKKYSYRKYTREESINRAYSRLGEDWYNILLNNCEHFVTWCITGIHSSSQVNKSIQGLTAVATKISYKKPLLPKDIILNENIVKTVGKYVAKNTTQKAISSSITSSLVSTSSGIAAGGATLTSGITGGSAITTALTTVGISSTVTTIAVPATVAVAVGYGVKKLWDWLSD